MVYQVCNYLKSSLHSKKFVVVMGWPSLNLSIHVIKLLYHGALIKFSKKTVCSYYWTWEYWTSASNRKWCWVFNKWSFQYICLDLIKKIIKKTIHYFDISILHSIYSVHIYHKYTIPFNNNKLWYAWVDAMPFSNYHTIRFRYYRCNKQ